MSQSYRAVAGMVVLAAMVVIGTPTAFAYEMEGASSYHPAPPRQPPLFFGMEKADPSLAVLPRAAVGVPDRLEKMHRNNRQGAILQQNGFRREIQNMTVSLGNDALSSKGRGTYTGGIVIVEDETLVWTARVEVEDAYAFRIHLQEVVLSPGAKIWVYASEEEFRGPFGLAHLDPEDSIWLPPIFGSEAYLQVHVPLSELGRAETVQFQLAEVMEIVDLADPGLKAWTDCSIDPSCVGHEGPPMLEAAMEGVALLTFNDDGTSYQCTGALIRSGGQREEIPYLLTANHCFDTQASASSLVAYFDYHSDECDGDAPSLSSVPQVFGATLLSTDPINDHTFVRLNTIPDGNNYYFGWTTEIPLEPQLLYRVSHPAGGPQKYATSRFLAAGGITCDSNPRPDFHYSYGDGEAGSTTGISSGSPLFTNFGKIVGQLLGFCGYEGSDECDYSTFNYIDGSFTTTFPYISDFLLAGPECPADVYETQGSKGYDDMPTDDTCYGAQIGFSTPQTHTLCDSDWIWFQGKAGSAYRIELTNLTGGLIPKSIDIGLHRNCGEMLRGDMGAIEMDFLATEDARYDVHIYFDGWWTYVTGEGYTVTVTCLSNCDDVIFQDGFESGDLSAWF